MRDESRLLVVKRKTGERSHRRFNELAELLNPGDCLALNDTRVLPSRFLGKRKTGAQVELLLIRAEAERVLAFVRGRGRVKPGETLDLEGGKYSVELLQREGKWGEWWIRFHEGEDPASMFHRGRAPLPPYIAWAEAQTRDEKEDLERYQTVYAEKPGSIAAPTAGLHFTPELLEKIQTRGIALARITLHVGPGTFLPVREEELENHHLLPEHFEILPSEAEKMNQSRKNGKRIVAVGTTVTRVLESQVNERGEIRAGSGDSGLFIYPPFTFRAVDALVTNFHLPESTLLMLVSSFMGREACLEAYREAISKEYRFYSFGDAMFIE